MNNFKYQKKPNTSEKSMNDFKDFNKVLDKHNGIVTSYKALWKWAIITTSSIGILAGLWFLTPSKQIKPQKIVTEKTQISVQPKKVIQEKLPVKGDVAQPEIIKKQPLVQNAEIPKKISKPTYLTQVEKIEKPIEQKENFVKESKIEPAEVHESKPEVWYTLNELPEKERIKLPTLFVSKTAWPSELTKTALVKSPKINAIYQSINRETPIVKGQAYITSKNQTQKPTKFNLKGDNFSPGLIRAIHKAQPNSILLLKNVTVFIPGQGYVNLGDRSIEIKLDKNYQKKLDQGKVIE